MILSATFMPTFIFIFLFVTFMFGFRSALRSIFLIGMFSMFGSFFFAMLRMFYPILIVMFIMGLIINKNNPNRNRTHFSYHSFNGGQGFEEFFRNQGGSGFHNSGYSGYGGSQNNPFGGFENKDKYYTTLGIDKGASPDEIKKAYRSKARTHHPDRYAQEPDNIRAFHEKKFKEINEAYEKLTN